MRTISCGDFAHDARTSWTAPCAEVSLLRDQAPMPAHQRIRRNEGVQPQQRSTSDSLRLSRQQRSFGVAKSNAFSAQPLFEQLILCFQELDDLAGDD
jgi:hypothetical protein